jgi:hypothetical protein
MGSGQDDRGGMHGVPCWERSSKRRIAKIKMRGNSPSLRMSLIFLALVL